MFVRPTLACVLALGALTALPAAAQSEAAGIEYWFNHGHTDAWRHNAQHCKPFLDQAKAIEQQMQSMPRGTPAFQAKTAQRSELVQRFKNCANDANRTSLRPLTPKLDERNSWADPAAGIFVDANGARWQFPTTIDHRDPMSGRSYRFRLDTSSPPASASAQFQMPLAQYLGPNGARISQYGRRLPARG